MQFLIIFSLQYNKKDDTSVYNTKKITKEDLSVRISATGTLNPTNSVDIGIEVSGNYKEIYVRF